MKCDKCGFTPGILISGLCLGCHHESKTNPSTPCPECGGNGKADFFNAKVACEHCDGTGLQPGAAAENQATQTEAPAAPARRLLASDAAWLGRLRSQ